MCWSRKDGEENLFMFPVWGRIVETLLIRENGMKLKKNLSGQHQGVSLSGVIALIHNGNAELNYNVPAVCSGETREKKMGIAWDIRKMLVLLHGQISGSGHET